jgi:hypothetical protein
MGTYFHETIQQEFGVRKSFFFCLDWCKSKSTLVNIRDQQQSMHQIDPEEEDDDCVGTRQKVYNLSETRGFPLVVKDMR